MGSNPIIKFWKTILAIVLVILLVVVGCNIAVNYNAKGRVFDKVEEMPHNTYGLLLATSPITRQGEHNFYFDNRIKAADSPTPKQ